MCGACGWPVSYLKTGLNLWEPGREQRLAVLVVMSQGLCPY